MLRLPVERRQVNSIDLGDMVERALDSVWGALTGQVNEWLGQAAAVLLARQPYERRERVCWWVESGQCVRCGSRQSQRFTRNGYRERHVLTPWGELVLALPRVVCQCGGSVQLDFGAWLPPYQRLSPELEEQIRRWGHMCVSLRQMQAELARSRIGPLGLRTLLKRLHQLQSLTPADLTTAIPPILQLDAIWITQLVPTGRIRKDAKGRRRAVKGRVKRPLFIALGVWPETGESHVLAWQLAQDESTEAWVAFLSLLEEQGLRGANGLDLIIHDGGAGLCSALEEVHFDAEQQRCLFHKLRNIAQAIQVPEELSHHERKRLKKAILKDFQAIWQAHQYRTALRRYLQVVRRYRISQPAAVATLRRDFRMTLTYYAFEKNHPLWKRKHLRTTSRLERFNKNLRRHLQAAGAYHSDQGILAMAAQVALAWRQSNARD